MRYLMLKIFLTPVICGVMAVPIFAQTANVNQPSIGVQRFQPQNGVNISRQTVELLMNNLIDEILKIKKFSQIKMVEPPITNQPGATTNPLSNPPTADLNFLMTGVITKYTSRGVVTKITSGGILDKTVIYITFSITDQKTGKVIIKRSVEGEIVKSFLLKSAAVPARKIAGITKKGL